MQLIVKYLYCSGILQKIHIWCQAYFCVHYFRSTLGCFKKIENVKKLSKFIGIWAVDNGLIVSPSKNYKIPENIWYFKTHVNAIVFSRVGTPPRPPFSEGTPTLFLKQIQKVTPSFWEPSKVVHVNCKKHLKMKVLRFVLY